MNKKRELQRLNAVWTGCVECSLSDSRQGSMVAFGYGPSEADILLVVDAPSADDMELAQPLSCKLGDVFDEVLVAAGIDPEHVFRTSLVACHPSVLIPATETSEEERRPREPNRDEIQACLPRLYKIIYTVDPRLIVTLGPVSWKALVAGKDRDRILTTVKKAQGKLFKTRIPGVTREITYPVLAVVHPQQFVANPSEAKHGPIKLTAKYLHRAGRYVNWLKRSEVTDL